MPRLGSPAAGQRHLVRGIRAVEHPRDDAVLALVDRARRGLAAHRAVDGLDRHLAGERRGVRLPRRDLALARLPRRGRGVQRLADRLVDRLGVEAEERADAGRGRRAEVGDVVDLVLVQADRAHEVDLDLVAGREAAHERRAVGADVLRDGEDRRDVVARVRVVGGEERVVVVELAHGDAVRPRRPLGAGPALERAAEHGRRRRRRPTRRGRGPAGARRSRARG